jgi:hypothetical protein
VSLDERIAIHDALSPHIDPWAAMWWYETGVRVSALGHPWRFVPYGPALADRLNMALRPYRYTMRRKVRKAFHI